jgi:GAF domain-containing protein
MSETFKSIDSTNKPKFYKDLEQEVRAQLEHLWLTNLATVSAILMAQMKDINWVGFYLFDDSRQPSELILGPFQGLPACLRIAIGKGVCGTAASRRATVIVEDVDQFPGHIACDSRSRSEIVVPIVVPNNDGDRLIGVLDVDSASLSRFDGEDKKGLEALVNTLIEKTIWPARFS